MKKNRKYNKKVLPILVTSVISGVFIGGIIGMDFGAQKYITTNAAQYEVANASTTSDGMYKYEIQEDGTIKITDYLGSDTVIIIPKTIEKKKVTTIGNYAFSSTKLTSVKIQEGVTTIEKNAFAHNTLLTSIEIPEGVTSLGDAVFYNSGITSIKIPKTVTSLPKELFSQCTSLETVEIPDAVTIIGERVFYNCKSLTEIEIPESVVSIGNHAFSACIGLSKVQIPFGVKTLGNSVFYGTNLIKVTIPPNVTSIGSNLFQNSTTQAIYCVSGSTAHTYAENNNLRYILDSYAPSVNIMGNPTDWSTENVTLKIGANDGEFDSDGDGYDDAAGLANKPFSFDGGITWQKGNSKTFESNASPYIKVRDALGNTRTTQIQVKIDKLAPQIEEVTKTPSYWTNGNVTLSITAKDNGIGLAEKPYSFDGGTTWQAGNTKEYTENTSGILILVKDALGNITPKNEINITNIDKDAPQIISVTGNPTGWTTESVTLEINAKDELSGLSKAYSFDGGETWQFENTKEYTQNTNGIMIQVKDNAGNITEYEEINITKIRKVEKIEVSAWPKKMNYKAYENFESDGLKVTVTYDNGNTEETTDYTIVGGESLTCLVEKVEIRYNLNSELKIDIPITVEHDLKVATCTEPVKCKIEGCDYTEGEALKHNYEAKVTDPTCTNQGYTTHECKRCQHSYVDTYTDALKHDFSSYVINKEATCTEEGEKTYQCSRCEETKKEAIPVQEHIPDTAVIENKVEPTYTTEGSYDEVIYCSKCKKELSRESKTIEKLSLAGDVNQDGKVNARDAKLVLQYYTGNIILTEEEKLKADVNQDGKINARDAKLILQYYTGQI